MRRHNTARRRIPAPFYWADSIHLLRTSASHADIYCRRSPRTRNFSNPKRRSAETRTAAQYRKTSFRFEHDDILGIQTSAQAGSFKTLTLAFHSCLLGNPAPVYHLHQAGRMCVDRGSVTFSLLQLIINEAALCCIVKASEERPWVPSSALQEHVEKHKHFTTIAEATFEQGHVDM